MTIGSVGGYNPLYAGYSTRAVNPDAMSSDRIGASQDAEDTKPILNYGESTEKTPGHESSPAECETCKNRKYQDGSDEMVSFKSAAHISPEASASRVMAHEQEHVANAYAKAAQKGGQVLSTSVRLTTAVCPECGRTYVSGGETATQIKYTNETNPYQQDKKSKDATGLRGMNLDIGA